MEMLSILLAHLAFLIFNVNTCCKDDKYATIIENICREHVSALPSGNARDSLAAACMTLITEKGTWNDIDYASVSMTEWSPGIHLKRVLALSTAYISPESRYFASEELFRQIVLALQWWNENRPVSDNWWYQWVGAPQDLGLILILMRHGKNRIPEELEKSLLKTMEKTAGDPEEAGSKGSAANKIDVSVHWIYRGVLNQDDAVLTKGFRNIFLPVSFTTGEGIQNDFSYLQHGPQLYIGGYGEVLAEKVAWAAAIARGTEYGLTPDKMDILANFILNTYLPAMSGKWILGNVSGRQIARKGALDKTYIVPTLERMSKLDVPNCDKYQKAILAIKENQAGPHGNPDLYRHYWRADYSLSSMECGQFDVRMVSTRTYRSENGNGENMLGYFLSDGASFITVDGDEYEDIYPVWDWSAIPGTTTPHLPDSLIPVPREWGVRGTSPFAGGVKGSSCGITAYKYVDTNAVFKVKADKSWFFCRNEVVCIGSALSCDCDYPLVTTVNQTLSKGTIGYGDANGSEMLTGQYKNGHPDWIWHNKVGYFFPWDTPVECSDVERTGNWADINRNTLPERVVNRVFTASINHGVRPVADKYAYVVVRNVTLEQMKNYDGEHLRILQADDTAHVVYDRVSDCWGIAFFTPGDFRSDNLEIAVDAPCLIVLEKTPGKGAYLMNIASPEQACPEIVVEIQMTGIGKERVVAEFPVKDKRYAGMTYSYELFK